MNNAKKWEVKMTLLFKEKGWKRQPFLANNSDSFDIGLSNTNVLPNHQNEDSKTVKTSDGGKSTPCPAPQKMDGNRKSKLSLITTNGKNPISKNVFEPIKPEEILKAAKPSVPIRELLNSKKSYSEKEKGNIGQPKSCPSIPDLTGIKEKNRKSENYLKLIKPIKTSNENAAKSSASVEEIIHEDNEQLQKEKENIDQLTNGTTKLDLLKTNRKNQKAIKPLKLLKPNEKSNVDDVKPSPSVEEFIVDDNEPLQKKNGNIDQLTSCTSMPDLAMTKEKNRKSENYLKLLKPVKSSNENAAKSSASVEKFIHDDNKQIQKEKENTGQLTSTIKPILLKNTQNKQKEIKLQKLNDKSNVEDAKPSASIEVINNNDNEHLQMKNGNIDQLTNGTSTSVLNEINQSNHKSKKALKMLKPNERLKKKFSIENFVNIDDKVQKNNEHNGQLIDMANNAKCDPSKEDLSFNQNGKPSVCFPLLPVEIDTSITKKINFKNNHSKNGVKNSQKILKRRLTYDVDSSICKDQNGIVQEYKIPRLSVTEEQKVHQDENKNVSTDANKDWYKDLLEVKKQFYKLHPKLNLRNN